LQQELYKTLITDLDLSTTPLTNDVQDRRTHRQIEFPSLDRVCIPCSAIKIGLRLSVCPSASNLTVTFLDRFSPKLAQT